jgi:LacI family transcriptional regulator
MTRIQDVAKLARVGVGTVSRVLNDSPNVSEETRARVEAAVRELGYRPSSAARALSSGRSTAVCLVAPTLTRADTAERFRHALEALRNSALDSLVNLVDRTELQRFISMRSETDRPAGMLLIDLPIGPTHVEQLRAAGVEVVAVGTRVSGIPGVSADVVMAGRLAARHLLELGHRRITVVQRAEPAGGSTAGRRAGFLEEARAAGLRPVVETVTDPDDEQDRALVERLLVSPSAPTAMAATSDDVALGIMRVARASGIAIPEQLSVVGGGDLETARYAGLTTVREHLSDSGDVGARMLLDLIGGEDVEDRELPVELVVRETTARRLF